MTRIKTIQCILPALLQEEGMGARVRRSIGSASLRRVDPFLMLDEFTVAKPAGFPDHPHRGFETVTYLLQGEVHHEDHKGHAGRIGPGDVQWMTAGRGIVHAEMPGGEEPATGLQLWINLPATHKMMEPRYQELASADIPVYEDAEAGVSVKVLAGQVGNVRASIGTLIPIVYLDVRLTRAGASFTQPIPEGYSSVAYVLEGQPVIGEDPGAGSGQGQKGHVAAHSLALLSLAGDSITLHAPVGPARVVVMAGQPIHEHVVQHGPFVMNTQEEIQEAFADYHYARNGFEGVRAWASKIGRQAP